MTGSLGVVGDLCQEAEWIARRLRKVKLSLSSCCHADLELRLRQEVDDYEIRCRQILEMMSTPVSAGSLPDGLHTAFLSELLTRSVRQNYVL